jgi:hypothetical protein
MWEEWAICALSSSLVSLVEGHRNVADRIGDQYGWPCNKVERAEVPV